jgi:hypothetical protein
VAGIVGSTRAQDLTVGSRLVLHGSASSAVCV